MSRLELFAASEDVLYPKTDTTTQIRFARDAQGRVTGLVAHLLGVVEVRGTKLPDTD